MICLRHRHSLGKQWKQRRPCQYPKHCGGNKAITTRNVINIKMYLAHTFSKKKKKFETFQKTQTFSKHKNDENTSLICKSNYSRCPCLKKIWYPWNLDCVTFYYLHFFRLYGFLVSYLIVFSLLVCKINSFGQNSKTALCV